MFSLVGTVTSRVGITNTLNIQTIIIAQLKLFGLNVNFPTGHTLWHCPYLNV